MPTLFDNLDGAQMVRYDRELELLYVWHGGHGVHAYTADGQEVGFWNVGDFSKPNADIDEVVRCMDELIRSDEEV